MLPRGAIARLWLAALPAAGVAWVLRPVLHGPVVSGCLVLGAFGVVYLAITRAMGIATAREITRRLVRR